MTNPKFTALPTIFLLLASCKFSNFFSEEKQLASFEAPTTTKPFLLQTFYPADPGDCPHGGFRVELNPDGVLSKEKASYQLLSCVTKDAPGAVDHVPPTQMSLNRPWGDCKFEDLKVANSPVWRFDLNRNSWTMHSPKDEFPVATTESLMINLQDFSDLDFLTGLENLKFLLITGLPSGGNLSLPDLPNVKYLCVRNLGLKNLNWMESVPNLQLVDLRENQIKDFSPLIKIMEEKPDFGIFSDLRIRGRQVSLLGP